VATEKYLAVIGLGEAETAHLRLLLRKVAANLDQSWRWGTEDNADLIIVDPSDLPGQIGRNRAFSSGRRCAVFHADEPLRSGELRLARPLKADDLVHTLNSIGSPSFDFGAPVLRASASDDFYALDSLDPSFAPGEDTAVAARAGSGDAIPALGLDELLQPDSEAGKPRFAVPHNLDAETRVERGSRSISARGDRRIADSVRGIRGPDGKPEGINIAASEDVDPAAANARHPLGDYLHQNLLGGPARASLPGATDLVLDPKTGMFHAEGGLSALAAYCRSDLPRSAWRQVTTQELARLRAQQPARPYANLLWLDAFIRSDGHLARHLDPGGRFRLTGSALDDADFPHHARIVAALEHAAKLNEIAAAAQAPMADVFDVVSAYAAIDRIQVEGRHAHRVEPGKQGLFARLSKSFSRK
jgi:hypothetical protein